MIENTQWLRFIPYTWVITDFKDIAKSISLSGKKLPQRNYANDGILPVIDQGQNFIAGYTNETNLKVDCKLPIIVFGDHTKVIKFINFSFVAGADGVKVLQPSGIINPKFLYYILLIIPLPDKGYARHFQYLEKSLVPLPPLPEQQRIVAKIEELFTKLDAGIDTMKKIRLQLKRYRQSVLKSAFEGKLTAEWREAHKGELEPASELLERIKAERKRAGKYKELPPLDTTELPELPEGWVWGCLYDSVSDTQIGLDRALIHQNKQGTGFAYIKMNNITMEGKVVLNELSYIDASEVEIARYKVCKDDILFNTRNSFELVGKTGIVKNNIENTLYNNNLMRIRTSKYIMSVFIAYQMCSPQFRQRMEKVKRATTNVAAIYAKDILPLPIVIISLLEQQKIVEEIERHFSIADKIETTIEQSLKHAERLRQSILKQAFEGKLVPQDPSDEPAEKLLERIKAEKAQNQTQPKRRRTSNGK